MDEYKRRRRRSRAVMSMFLDSIGGSIDNVDVATFDSDGGDLKALIIGIEPVQSGTGNPSPDNVRPITGHSSVNVIVSPTLNPLDGTITNIPLGQTVYGGTLDVLTGVLTVNRAMVTFDGSTDEVWSKSGNALNGYYISMAANGYPAVSGVPPMKQYPYFVLCNMAINTDILDFYYSNYGYCYADYTLGVNINPAACGNTIESFRSFISQNNLEFVYEVDTPQTIQLTGQQIDTFLGTNNVWCDSGKIIHLEY